MDDNQEQGTTSNQQTTETAPLAADLASLFSAAKPGESAFQSDEIPLASQSVETQATTQENAAPPAAQQEVDSPDISTQFTSYATEQFGLDPDAIKTRLSQYEAIAAEREKLKAEVEAREALTQEERELLGVYRSGMDPAEYQLLQKTDFTKMDPIEVLKTQFKKDNPTAPAHLLEALFEDELSSKYPHIHLQDPEDLSYQKDSYKMGLQVEQIRSGLIAHQQKNRYSPPPAAVRSEGNAPALSQEQIDQAAQELAVHQANVQAVLDQQSNLSFAWKDAERGDRAINVEVTRKADVAAFMKDPGQFLQAHLEREMIKENGEVDYPKLHRFGALLLEGENYLRKAYESGGDSKEIELRKEKRNAQLDGTTASDTLAPTVGDLAAEFRKLNGR